MSEQMPRRPNGTSMKPPVHLTSTYATAAGLLRPTELVFSMFPAEKGPHPRNEESRVVQALHPAQDGVVVSRTTSRVSAREGTRLLLLSGGNLDGMMPASPPASRSFHGGALKLSQPSRAHAADHRAGGIAAANKPAALNAADPSVQHESQCPPLSPLSLPSPTSSTSHRLPSPPFAPPSSPSLGLSPVAEVTWKPLPLPAKGSQMQTLHSMIQPVPRAIISR